jgi:acyl-CoA synthetase (AMP-forming)/AMP-acid ligase II
MLITEILSRNARMYGQETALIEREPERNRRVEITWETFDDQANAIAHALMTRGVEKGDRVVHLMMNCIQWLPAYFGILKTGAWAVPLNFRFVVQNDRQLHPHRRARVFIFGEEFLDRVTEIRIRDRKQRPAHLFSPARKKNGPPGLNHWMQLIAESPGQPAPRTYPDRYLR